MGQAGFSRRLFRIRLYVFEICETAIFVALVLALAIYSIERIIAFGRNLL
jgi:hypothetical protein